MDIGNRITQLREAKGFTTNRLANHCGLSQSFLRAVELGEKGISVESLSLICESLEISLSAFFNLPNENDTQEAELQRQIEKLTPKQKAALSSFLQTL